MGRRVFTVETYARSLQTFKIRRTLLCLRVCKIQSATVAVWIIFTCHPYFAFTFSPPPPPTKAKQNCNEHHCINLLTEKSHRSTKNNVEIFVSVCFVLFFDSPLIDIWFLLNKHWSLRHGGFKEPHLRLSINSWHNWDLNDSVDLAFPFDWLLAKLVQVQYTLQHTANNKLLINKNRNKKSEVQGKRQNTYYQHTHTVNINAIF